DRLTHLGGRAVHHIARTRQGGGQDVVVARDLAPGVLAPHVDRRLALVPAPGEDLDHAVIGAGAVESRGGRAFQDLDALDVRRRDVREPVAERGPAVRGVGPQPDQRTGVVLHDDAVDHDQRLRAAQDRAGASEPNAYAAARLAVVLRNDRAGDLPL